MRLYLCSDKCKEIYVKNIAEIEKRLEKENDKNSNDSDISK
jgi:endogenous inhibitor of DNA gyrase (YacG/DUF329 family)